MTRINRLSARAVALALTLGAAGAAVAADYTIKDTSFRDPVSGRVQQLVLEVPVSADAAWAAISTDAGLKGWVAPVVHIDLMNGGMLEASYSASSHLGDRENIRNQIIAYVPGRMMVYQNIHVPKGAPADFALLAALRTTIEIEPVDAGHARIIESGVGYGEGPGFDALYAHFSAGNRYEFDALAKSLTGHPIDWAAEAASAKASVGDKK